MFKRIFEWLSRLVKRFFSDEPRNPYERIAFGAVRDTAGVLGRAA